MEISSRSEAEAYVTVMENEKAEALRIVAAFNFSQDVITYVMEI